MAASSDSSPPRGYKSSKDHKARKSRRAAKPTKALNSTEKPILVNDDDSNQSSTDQTKDSDISSLDWEEDRKGKGKGRGRGRRRGKGKGKGEEKKTRKPTEADQTYQETYQEKEIDAGRTLVTLSKTISNILTAPYDNKKEPNQLKTDKTAHETSDHRNKLPIEIWIKIWEIVANDNPRNLDIWT
ncbi:uncharacterized protein EAF02_001640 [Botrytis sinoallii]|uniref:uncharacterized protein n=1 Tax=Botrytis sinoallii TaxID=1463999 RepID=UPI0019027AB2|nr:uncharacterized protein EAF02_001640 [Botrytis sinoallii]KAF7891315.1 hypothetical protein EAF02_001640 [Botrytis sinoallii]